MSIKPKTALFLLVNKINTPISKEREVIAKFTPPPKEFINLIGVYTIVLLIIFIMPKMIRITPMISDINFFRERYHNLFVDNNFYLLVIKNIGLF